MSVTIDEVKMVAALARLQFSPGEEAELRAELNRILNYMEKLEELDTDEVEPTSHVVPIVNAWRRDEVEPFPSAGGLLQPESRLDRDYLKVPRIID